MVDVARPVSYPTYVEYDTDPMRITYPTAIVLLAVSRGVRHGFDIMDASGLASGTVYPILRRLEDEGMVRSRWEAASTARDEQRPPRRYYTITGAGSSALRDATARFPGLAGTLGGSPATA
jgi:DNA-binding PadR family transcriptional regulator